MFNKPITVDFFTTDQLVHDQYSVESKGTFPQWFRALPTYNSSNMDTSECPHMKHNYTNARNCLGIQKLYKNAITIPLFTDIEFYVKDERMDWTYAYSPEMNGGDVVRSHPHDQSNNFFSERFHHAKIVMPWLARETKGIDFYINMWDWNTNIHSIKNIGGVVDFKYQHTTNLNFFVTKVFDHSFFLEAGMPLVQIIPLTERKVKVKTHLVDKKELDRLFPMQTTFQRKYAKQKKWYNKYS